MAKPKSFEASMERLQEIVDLLEENEAPLDETIALFEEGLKLIKSCDDQLKAFELKVEELTKAEGESE
ncbi:MAG: exodeoxyribonuclease VII small subunit [Solobacterium sp.]|nr:exodeoxyribonuclease VII small subunit [Solobacterium sp.]